MRRLLWVGDAVVSTGFAKCTHKILEAFLTMWDIHVLGINYIGDPHPYPYNIYPCMPGGDAFGVNRVGPLVSALRPDLVVIQNDPWNIPGYMKCLSGKGGVPVVATMPVDGKNCQGHALNGLRGAIFWTEFGRREATQGGYRGESYVIPLGVDLESYSPQDKKEARAAIGIPEPGLSGFIVGNVNRNQPRKRLDLTIEYFAKWVRDYRVEDAYLFLHVAPTGDLGYDVSQLMKYYGMANRLILSEPERGFGVSESSLRSIYNSFDVQVTTTQGEGWGLTTMEGMACGVPQIVPNWAALGEWARDAVATVPCTSTCVTPNSINIVGGVPSQESFVETLDRLYRSPEERKGFGDRGLTLVNCPQFSWKEIGREYVRVLDEALGFVHAKSND